MMIVIEMMKCNIQLKHHSIDILQYAVECNKYVVNLIESN